MEKLNGCTGVTDKTRIKFVDGLSSEIIDNSASAISDCYPECIHISATRVLLRKKWILFLAYLQMMNLQVSLKTVDRAWST